MDSQKVKEISQIFEKIQAYENVDVDKALNSTYRKIRKHRIVSQFRFIAKYAALFFIPLFVAYLFFGEKNNALHSEKQLVEVTAAPGTIVKYILPDSTIVWLNSCTKLTHSVSFDSSEREVMLNGEAFFDVNSSESNPFLVHTSYGISTYVYGTEFNVYAYTEDEELEVSLVTGKLDLINESGLKVNLPVGYKASLIDEKLQVEKTDIDQEYKWKEGVLVFNNSSLKDIMMRLERFYNVEINIESKSGSDLNIYSLRSIFTHETIEQILNYLSETIGASWTYVRSSAPNGKRQINFKII